MAIELSFYSYIVFINICLFIIIRDISKTILYWTYKHILFKLNRFHNITTNNVALIQFDSLHCHLPIDLIIFLWSLSIHITFDMIFWYFLLNSSFRSANLVDSLILFSYTKKKKKVNKLLLEYSFYRIIV